MKQTPESTADYLDRHMIEAMKELAKERFNPNKRQTMKQTAVEWLVEQLKEYDWADIKDSQNWVIKIDALVLTAKVEQAKAMEREQIKDAYLTGQYDLADKKFGPEQYYNETYSRQENNVSTGAVGYKALEHKEPVVVGTLRGPNGNTAIFKGDAAIGTEEINPFKKGNK